MSSLPFRAATGYDVLQSNEDGYDEQIPSAGNSSPSSQYPFKILIYTIVVTLSVWGFMGLLLFPKEFDCNCGSSIADAIAKGCKYDAMATSWLPAKCRDDELSAEFDAAGPGGAWDYYADSDGNQSYTLHEVAMLAEKTGSEAEFWTTHEWHINHCLFYWRKESRARVRGTFIEKSFEGDYHVHHCSKTLTACRPLDEIDTKSVAGLNSDL